MTPDPAKKSAARIDLNNAKYWAERFKISTEDLKQAIKETGSSIAADVEKHLASHNSNNKK